MPPSLNFEKTKGAQAVAVVRGGDADGNVLYLHSEEQKSSKPKV